MAEAPDGSGNLFIVDQVGVIKVVTPDGEMQEEPFLDLKDKIVPLKEHYDERGLLGLVFHPDYASNGRFFVYYSAPLRPEAPDDFNHTSHIAEFKVMAGNPLMADKSSEKIYYMWTNLIPIITSVRLPLVLWMIISIFL